MINNIVLGDCLEVMKDISNNSVDFVLIDPPYGYTAAEWDNIIDFESLWLEFNRIVKPNKAVAIFGTEPFSSYLRLSNIKKFKYDWIWNKKLAGNSLQAKLRPLKIHEIVSIFCSSSGSPPYYPVKTKGRMRKKGFNKNIQSELFNYIPNAPTISTNNDYYPTSIQEFSMAARRKNRFHPTEKSIPFLEFLIKTYTNENDIVLDCCAGSGSTLIAAKNLNRQFIGIEKEEKYFNICLERLKE